MPEGRAQECEGRQRRYPEYKDSGVEWLGEIPVHWEAVRLGYLAAIGNGSTPGRDNSEYWVAGTYPWLTSARINDGIVSAANEFVTQAALRECHLPIVPAGSVLVAITGEGQTRGRAALLVIESTISQPLAYLSPRDERCRAAYARRSLEPCYEWLRRESSGAGSTRAALTCEFLRSVQLAIPPSSEQDAITAFLDRETARIDALVAKKERLIELLQEKRTALITRAVTKGLDPDVPMKDSGVEWLGEIPVHWGVEANRWLFRESDTRSQLGEEKLLTVSHITGVTPRSEKPSVTMIEAESHEGYKICRAGEIVVNTMWAWMGALGVASQHGMVSPSYNVYRIARAKLVPRYYDYLCRVPIHVAEIVRHSKGIWRSRLRLYPDAFREMSAPVPPVSEQRTIAAFLDRETERADALLTKVRAAITLLKELRTALISAAVTGRIDVREEVA